MTSFKDLGLSAPVLQAIQELGFEEPTSIQEKAIPLLLEGYRDFIGLAQTGTGKTAAFGLPLVDLVEQTDPSTQAVILAPTRELCQQIAHQMEIFSSTSKGLKVMPVFGGAPISSQIKSLKSKTPQILIATPGRLIDLLNRKAVKLNEVDYLVLDEADEMLNMGFQEELDEILRFTPAEKVTWLFSATMPKDIRKMVNQYMTAPFEVKIDQKDRVNANIVHQYVPIQRSNKLESLLRFIDIDPEMKAVIFCRTRMDAQNLAEDLIKRGYRTDAIHGDLAQKQRDLVMDRFRTADMPMLIATDVAARGIDVDDITHVFHYTLPDDTGWYTHRSGRTARAGKTGKSIAFVEQRDFGRMKRFEQDLKITFERVWVPQADEVAYSRIEKWAHQVLTRKARHLDNELLSRIQLLFSGLSKDELIAKMVKNELEALNVDTHGDLNTELDKRPARSSGGRKSRGGGSRGKRKFSDKRKGGPKNKRGGFSKKRKKKK